MSDLENSVIQCRDRSHIAAVSGSLFLDSERSHMVKSQLGHEGETFLKVKSELSL